MTTTRSEARRQESLTEITRLLERHRVLTALRHRQEGRPQDLVEQLQNRQMSSSKFWPSCGPEPNYRRKPIGVFVVDFRHVLPRHHPGADPPVVWRW